jgi:hypothetical protein
MVERSCYECAGCFTFDKSNCKLARYTGNAKRRTFQVNASNGGRPVAERAAREAAPQLKLHAKIKKSTNGGSCAKATQKQQEDPFSIHALEWGTTEHHVEY